MLEAEGFAMRPGPKPFISKEIVYILRNSVKACLKISIVYESVNENELTQRTICPYGFIYGKKHYMIAWCDSAEDIRMFSLANIKEASITAEPFVRDQSFSIQKYAEQSFGVFQEEPFYVVWKFSPDAASNAKEYLFHPTQKITEQEDGSLMVEFKAGGWMEMCWHLFTWGDDVEIIEPQNLKDKYQQMVSEIVL